MQRTAIELVSFAAPAATAAVTDLLDSHEWSVRTNAANRWLQASPGSTHPLILLLDKEPSSLDRLGDAMRQRRGPLLGVFAGSVASWDSDILRHCTDFVHWPCSRDELHCRLRRIAGCIADNPTQTALADDLAGINMIGASPIFLRALGAIRRIANCDAPVLIQGETGTGKELAARAVHYFSGRRDYPFIPVNCGALPDSLIENELFGHEKGAFTDAKESAPGLIAQADGGTLFLDEIDTLSPKAQIALLRFLQDRHYRPVGGKQLRAANVRLVAAANVNLALAVAAKQFREDLWFRIDVLSISLPPLREREADTVLLARHFLQKLCRESGTAKRFHPDTLAWLARQSWPGNVRQLQNVIQRGFFLADSDVIALHSAAPVVERRRAMDRRRHDFGDGFGIGKGRAIAHFERAFVDWALRESRGNVSAAARRAGKERRAFGKLLKKYGIDTRDYRADNDPDAGS